MNLESTFYVRKKSHKHFLILHMCRHRRSPTYDFCILQWCKSHTHSVANILQISFTFELFPGLVICDTYSLVMLGTELNWQWPELTVCHKNMRINNQYIDNCHSLTHFVFHFCMVFNTLHETFNTSL